jgi:hypothetical protein
MLALTRLSIRESMVASAGSGPIVPGFPSRHYIAAIKTPDTAVVGFDGWRGKSSLQDALCAVVYNFFIRATGDSTGAGLNIGNGTFKPKYRCCRSPLILLALSLVYIHKLDNGFCPKSACWYWLLRIGGLW